MTDRPNTNRQW